MKFFIEPQYFPPVDLFIHLIKSSHEIIFISDEYKKMSFRNRCVIAGSNGPIILSVPLIGGRNQRTPMHEILIDNRQPWQSHHWKSICSCYNHSPWFEFYKESLSGLFLRKFSSLMDWDLACFEWITRQLQLRIKMETTVMDQTPADINLVNRFLPRDLEKFLPIVRYPQVFEDRTGFIPHLSILDLLFCAGTNSLKFLQTSEETQSHSNG